MKKFFTVFIFTCVFLSTSYAIETPLSADIQKQYDNLKTLIQHADSHAFKVACDALVLLSNESITELEQLVVALKAEIHTEIEVFGDNSKNWSKLVRGALATAGSSWIIAAMITFSYDVWIARRYFIPIRKRITLLNAPITLPLAVGVFFDTRKGRATRTCTDSVRYCIIAVTPTLICSGFMCGYKNLKAGWNYKHYLQDKITNLEAIERILHVVKKYKLLIFPQ